MITEKIKFKVCALIFDETLIEMMKGKENTIILGNEKEVIIFSRALKI